MTRRDYCNELNPIGQIDATPGGGLEQVLELLTDHGFDGMAQAMQTLFNEAMKLERSVALGANRTSVPTNASATRTAISRRRSARGSANLRWRYHKPVTCRFILRRSNGVSEANGP